jgi:hypothetical protein
MGNILEGCIEQVLNQDEAKQGDVYSDDFGNNWLVHEDRDGLRLEHYENKSAQIPYWTASLIKLPGFRRIG